MATKLQTLYHIHQALVEGGLSGQLIPKRTWDRCLLLATDTMSHATLARQTQVMETLGLIRAEAHGYVVLGAPTTAPGRIGATTGTPPIPQ